MRFSDLLYHHTQLNTLKHTCCRKKNTHFLFCFGASGRDAVLNNLICSSLDPDLSELKLSQRERGEEEEEGETERETDLE